MSGKRRVFSLGGRKLGSVGSGERIVKYSTGHSHSDNKDDDLEDIAIVSNTDLGEVTYGGGQAPNYSQANGPRLVPGIITSAGTRGPPPSFVGTVSERLQHQGSLSVGSPLLGGEHHNGSELTNGTEGGGGGAGEPPTYLTGRGATARASLGGGRNARSASKQSLLDLVGNRLGVSGGLSLGGVGLGGRNKRFSRESFSASAQANAGVGGGGGNQRSNLQSQYTPASASELDVSSKRSRDKRKDLRSKLKLDKWENSTTTSEKTGCRWTFVFDPAGRLCYYWSMVVSLAFLYNFWVLLYRFAFQEITPQTLIVWFCLDYCADFVYLIDIGVHFRTGYLEDGVLQTDSTKLRHHYMNSTTFYIDCLCLLPLDFLYLSIGFNSILRCFRLVKIYRFWAFMDRTERHTNYPNVFRSISLVHYLLAIYHWNACIFHIIQKNKGFGDPSWVYRMDNSSDVVMHYLQSFYWSTLTLSMVGDLPRPRVKMEYLYVIYQLLLGLFLFATVLGHVANIVTNVSAARKEFQGRLDGVKTYMRMRRVPSYLQVKVIKWFDYLWLTQKCSDEDKTVGCLPDKLKAEIAINVHLDTLRRVEIFQNTEAGFLCELVLRLRPVLFSPGDYICRKGEVGKEMYIVNRGRLQVVADDGKTVLATLKPGSYFGEISILNMGTAGNRRTASVRSVGYSDLFVLSKTDMWDVLKEYPAARVRLEAIACKRLEKYKKAPLEKGLVETLGQVPLEEMWVNPEEPENKPLIMSSAAHHSHGQHGQNSATSNSSIPSSEEDKSNKGHLPKINFYTSGASVTSSRESDARMASAASRSTATVLSPANLMAAPGGGGVTPSSFLHVPDHESSHLSISPLSADHVFFQQHHHPHPSTVRRLSGSAGSSSHMMMGVSALLDATQDAALLQEIRRLRERLVTLETENATLNLKLSQQQWEVEHRLAEIEMHICGASSAASSADEERNKESAI
ncbi:cyclic nucleotide-gated cation channel alpha-3 isoform X2 [Folsomia candida]|uniref:cyclic nucleotide-gated cation channel alpha-3 isoform X2 n=1 Tax=Folsomia candida TaxID=158441 RepID=UPI0016054F71|nr:cyclic nucleotide-gated cation channel alpha-3 isoform X2 [Folsomia candida]